MRETLNPQRGYLNPQLLQPGIWSTAIKNAGTWGYYFASNADLRKALDADELGVSESCTTPAQCTLYGRRDKLWYTICVFYMCQFPGLCGAAMVSNMTWSGLGFTYTKERHDALTNAYCEAAKNLGYSYLITAETRAYTEGAAESASYKRAGFKPILEFKNKRTSNQVEIIAKEL
jgi:hypothetical protein